MPQTTEFTEAFKILRRIYLELESDQTIPNFDSYYTTAVKPPCSMIVFKSAILEDLTKRERIILSEYPINKEHKCSLLGFRVLQIWNTTYVLFPGIDAWVDVTTKDTSFKDTEPTLKLVFNSPNDIYCFDRDFYKLYKLVRIPI